MSKQHAEAIGWERDEPDAEAPKIPGFAVGDQVAVASPGHRHDGRTGTVSYLGTHFRTVGVSIDGRDYGLFHSELTLSETAAGSD